MVGGLGIISGDWIPSIVNQGTAVTKLTATSVTTPLEQTIESGGIDPNATSWGMWIVVGLVIFMMLGKK